MTKPIIVGLDPLNEDEAPLHLANGLAQTTGAPLVAVAAYLHDPITDAVSWGAVERDLRAHATEGIKDIAGGTHAEVVVAGGSSPAHVLHREAAERDAAMIVIGSTRKGLVGRLTPGSTAERLLHGAHCPVAVATAGLPADWSPRRIGVGFIDVEEGREALRAGAALAAATGGSLTALTAVVPIGPKGPAVVQPYAVGSDEPARQAAERSLTAALERLPASLRTRGKVTLNDPVAALVELSRDVDLIVCGSRGYGPIRSVLLGAVTHWLTHEAHCPVVFIPRGVRQAAEQLASHQELAAT